MALSKRVIPPAADRRRWVHYAAALWAFCFAAPHTWWALGSPYGFPGGPANHHLWMTSWWRYLYDVIVVLLSILGAVVALMLRPGHTRLRRPFLALAWIAAVLLTLRGVAGLVVDGTSDLLWWPTFLAGGLLFGGVALMSRSHDVPSTMPPRLAR
jgi:hypothetical protein